MLMVLFAPETVANIQQILAFGLAVFIGIEALKATPLFADIFARWPMISVIVNALSALAIGIGKCFMGETGDMSIVFCLLAAVGIFLGAAGIHLGVQKLSRGAVIVPGAVSDKARSDLGLPLKPDPGK